MKALVLSGGGRKGAYQVGALEFLLGVQEQKYDYIFGVSVGALNGALLSMYKLGEEKEASQALRKLWDGIDNSSVHKRWFPFGKLHGLWKPSFLNSSPLKELVWDTFDPEKVKESERKLGVGAVSVKTGEYRIFTEKDPEIVQGILASSAFPAMLTPATIDNQIWVDGGVRNVTPLMSAITLGASEIDVIATMPEIPKPLADDSPNAIQIALRSFEIVMNEIANEDLRRCQNINHRVRSGGMKGKREIELRVLRPAEELEGDSLDFDPKFIQENIAQGRRDAEAAFGG
jgi:NTE family protein